MAMFTFTPCDAIAFAGNHFVLTGFGAEEEAELIGLITGQGGIVHSSFVLSINYLVVNENYDHQTVKYQRTVQLNQIGKNVSILSGSTLRNLCPARDVSVSKSVAEVTTAMSKEKKPKKETVHLSSIPVGPGSLQYPSVAWALLGFAGIQKKALQQDLEKKGSVVGNPSKQTQYLIYDPERGPETKYWAQAKQREEEGTLCLMTPLVYGLWSAKSLSKIFQSLGFEEKLSAVIHYLDHLQQWEGMGKPCQPLRDFVQAKHVLLAEELYRQGQYDALLNLLDLLAEMEVAWKAKGLSDGFYTYDMVNDYTDRVIAKQDPELTARFLAYQAQHFDPEFREEADAIAMDYALGLKARLGIYWAEGTLHTFGRYPQTKAGNDQSEIEWLVLARDGQKALLISRYALDAKPYNEKYDSITYEKCTIRRWLNGEFLNKAFTAAEQEAIVTTHVTVDTTRKYIAHLGNDTEDKVFLLSIPEAEMYFKSDTERRCAPTDYAVANKAWTDSAYQVDGKPVGVWWLRSPGSNQLHAAYVKYGGAVLRGGDDVSNHGDCVRPALWVNLESGIF